MLACAPDDQKRINCFVSGAAALKDAIRSVGPSAPGPLGRCKSSVAKAESCTIGARNDTINAVFWFRAENVRGATPGNSACAIFPAFQEACNRHSKGAACGSAIMPESDNVAKSARAAISDT